MGRGTQGTIVMRSNVVDELKLEARAAQRPLDRLGGMGGNQTVIVELDGRTIMRAVAPRFVDELRLKTGIAGL